jgi:hypothetical protein
MKYITTLLLIFSITLCFAQKTKQAKTKPKQAKIQLGFHTIEDKDGFANLRSSPKIEKNNVIKKLNNTSIVYGGDSTNWIDVQTFKNGKPDFGGYLYKDRIKSIETYLSIPQKTLTTHKIILKRDSVEISIEDKKYDAKKHKLKTYKNCVKGDEIDGKPFWGTDCGGGLPFTEYQIFCVQIGNDTINIPKSAYNDLYNGNIDNTKAFFDVKNDILYIEAFNSDGAGSYHVLWVVEKHKYRDRYIYWGW